MSHQDFQPSARSAAERRSDDIAYELDTLPLSEARGVSRRTAIKAMLSAVGAAVLFASPVTAQAEPQASQETLDALDDAQERYNEVESQLNEISDQYQELSKQQDKTLTQIEDVTRQIEDTQDQIEEKQDELKDYQVMLSERVASSYKTGGSEALTMLLACDTLDDLISNAYYIEKINEQDRAVIEQIEQIQIQLEEQKKQLEEQKGQLEDLKAKQADQLKQMQEKQEETQELLNNLDDEVKELVAQRDAEILAAAQAEAEAEAERKRQEEEARRQQEQQQQQQGGSSSSTPPVLPERGSGQDYNAASAAQKRVVNSCYYTASPGAGYCAAWVSYVMRNAGFGRVAGNANDMYNAWCTSSSKANLQVGMIVAVSTHSHTYAGRIYGHVGIYIGDNKIMENIGPINTQGIDTWISYYGTTVTPRWGWANGINLAERD